MALRLTKTVLVFFVGLFALIVAVNNVIDYGSNFQFVQKVLSMETTFPDNALLGRAINIPALHHIAYNFIIAFEFLIAFLCLLGCGRLFLSIRDVAAFRTSKSLAIYGLAAGITLWFGGFMVIGGEWFAMWQSEIWNGVPSAFRFTAIIGVVLLYLTAAPDDL